MGLWDKVNTPAGKYINNKRNKLAKKKAEMAKKMADHFSPSGQRHDFDRAVKK